MQNIKQLERPKETGAGAFFRQPGLQFNHHSPNQENQHKDQPSTSPFQQQQQQHHIQQNNQMRAPPTASPPKYRIRPPFSTPGHHSVVSNQQQRQRPVTKLPTTTRKPHVPLQPLLPHVEYESEYSTYGFHGTKPGSEHLYDHRPDFSHLQNGFGVIYDQPQNPPAKRPFKGPSNSRDPRGPSKPHPNYSYPPNHSSRRKPSSSWSESRPRPQHPHGRESYHHGNMEHRSPYERQMGMESFWEDPLYNHNPYNHQQQHYMNEPYMNDPYMNHPYMDHPYISHPYMKDPYMNEPYMNDPYMNDPYVNYMNGGGFFGSPQFFDQVGIYK